MIDRENEIYNLSEMSDDDAINIIFIIAIKNGNDHFRLPYLKNVISDITAYRNVTMLNKTDYAFTIAYTFSKNRRNVNVSKNIFDLFLQKKRNDKLSKIIDL